MASGARSGLKLEGAPDFEFVLVRQNGQWSPFGIEISWTLGRPKPSQCRRNGLGSPVGIETAAAARVGLSDDPRGRLWASTYETSRQHPWGEGF